MNMNLYHYHQEDIAERNRDAPAVTMLPRRHVRSTRIKWTCFYCNHTFEPGSSCWVMPFIEDGKFGSLRACTPNADCMDYDRGD